MRFVFFLLSIVFLCSNNLTLASNTRRVAIAIIDSEFCVNNINLSPHLKSKIIIHPGPPPAPLCGKNIPKERWAHGHHVLNLFTQELAKQLPGNLIIEIHPYKIFDADGMYTLKDWEDLLRGLMNVPPDLIIMASTYYGSDHSRLEESMKNFHGIFLLAAGAKDDTIQNPAFLWPQASKTTQKILFGSYVRYQTPGQKGTPQGQLDTGLFEQNGLDYVVEAPQSSVYPTGSSYAVARAAAFLLGRCPTLEMTSLLRCIGGFSTPTLLKSRPSPLSKIGKYYKAITFHK